MKKYILVTTALGLISACAYFRGEPRDFKKALEVQGSETKMIKPKISQKVDSETRATEVPETTVRDLEAQFSGLSEKELLAEVQKNSQFAIENKLFEKANSKGLGVADTELMVKFIRTNRVLHQILLERKLSEIESESEIL